jgi:hypothetical protein
MASRTTSFIRKGTLPVIAGNPPASTSHPSGMNGMIHDFARHDSVNHGAGEYGRGEVHTNTVEGFYSIFKRGMKGVYCKRSFVVAPRKVNGLV